MAWWLAYEELYGDMDKEYPIMTKGEEHSDSYYDYNRNCHSPDLKHFLFKFFIINLRKSWYQIKFKCCY